MPGRRSILESVRASSLAAASLVVACGLTEGDDEGSGRPDAGSSGGAAAGAAGAGAGGVDAGAIGGTGGGVTAGAAGFAGEPQELCTGECAPIGFRCTLDGLECACPSSRVQDCSDNGWGWPLYPPLAGEPCAGPAEGMVCDQPALGECGPSCTCLGGEWVCAPIPDICPFYACPDEEPTNGAQCDLGQVSQHCSYGDRRCHEVECECASSGSGEPSWHCLACFRPC